MPDEADPVPPVQADLNFKEIPGWESLMAGARDAAKLEAYGVARAFREAVVRISGPKMEHRFTLLQVMDQVRVRLDLVQGVLPSIAADEFNAMMQSGHLVQGERTDDSDQERFWYTFRSQGRLP